MPTFCGATLTGADFREANLTDAYFSGATLTDADFTDADDSWGELPTYVCTVGTGITLAQLYSTASYQAHDLSGIDFGDNDLAGGNFAGQNLTNANFIWSARTY